MTDTYVTTFFGHHAAISRIGQELFKDGVLIDGIVSINAAYDVYDCTTEMIVEHITLRAIALVGQGEDVRIDTEWPSPMESDQTKTGLSPRTMD